MFSPEHIGLSFSLFPSRGVVAGEGRERETSAYVHLNGTDFTHKKKHVIAVWVAQYENLSECERVDPTRKL